MAREVRDCFRLPCRKSLAWCFHIESILLWWRSLEARPRYAPRPALLQRLSAEVWVIEDDAGYSGDLAAFLAAYQPPGHPF